ncbi:MAG: dUTP diphosphatase [Ginsengibacter sp.]|jgi:dUTP pyrophosphatase
MHDIEIKIINTSQNQTPEYATAGASGFDLRAHLQESILLMPMERQLVPTGIFIEIPLGFEGQVRPRSGLAIKHGITCVNSPGTVDSDYRGELKVILINLSNEDFLINNGDRIAQMVVCKVERALLINTNELEATERGKGGFGHTGIS